jgi:effector-binding domain-containing protein
MKYPCTIKEKEAQPYLAIRTRTSMSGMGSALGRAYGAIGAYLGELGQGPDGAPFAAFHNQDMEDMDVEIGMPTAEILPGRGEIYGSEIPAGRFAECTYTGSYRKMEPAYEQLAEFVAEQGEEATGVAYEVYLDDASEKPQEEVRTLIVFPLR